MNLIFEVVVSSKYKNNTTYYSIYENRVKDQTNGIMLLLFDGLICQLALSILCNILYQIQQYFGIVNIVPNIK